LFKFNICILVGRTIVHEWGHYRWGLWDEYPVDKYPKVYEDDSGNMKGVQCGKYMKGKVHCVLEREGCTFEVDKSGAGVVASLMGDHRIPGVSRERDTILVDKSKHANLLPNIDLAWLLSFTRCNRLGLAQVARQN